MTYLTLNQIKLEQTAMGTKVQYDYDAPPSLAQYIRGGPLFIEFPGDVRSVPEAILTIPFVGIMLTVTMLLDIEIRVPTLEAVFCDSLRQIEAVFQSMYPKAGIRCKVDALRSETVEACLPPEIERCSLFFTGGVDATSALAELADRKPLLINIWGGDLRLTDGSSHDELEVYLNKLTSHIGLDYCFIKTNSREMFHENALGLLCEKLLGHGNNHGWWASIAHILSMSAAIAPWLWLRGINTHYIGSSYDPSTTIFDSNNTALIDSLRYCTCRFVSVDPQMNRNEKTAKIIAYRKTTNAPIQLKVCWNRTAGVNCSACEKCYRTIMNIIVNRDDPNQYGFVVDRNTIERMKHFLSTNKVSTAFWSPVQKAMQVQRENWKDTEMSWLLDIKLNAPRVYLYRIAQKLRTVIKK